MEGVAIKLTHASGAPGLFEVGLPRLYVDLLNIELLIISKLRFGIINKTLYEKSPPTPSLVFEDKHRTDRCCTSGESSYAE